VGEAGQPEQLFGSETGITVMFQRVALPLLYFNLSQFSAVTAALL
jgi:hypothetical protein